MILYLFFRHGLESAYKTYGGNQVNRVMKKNKDLKNLKRRKAIGLIRAGESDHEGLNLNLSRSKFLTHKQKILTVIK